MLDSREKNEQQPSKALSQFRYLTLLSSLLNATTRILQLPCESVELFGSLNTLRLPTFDPFHENLYGR